MMSDREEFTCRAKNMLTIENKIPTKCFSFKQ